MGIEPTHSHLQCDALPIELPSPWEQGGGEKGTFLSKQPLLYRERVSMEDPELDVFHATGHELRGRVGVNWMSKMRSLWPRVDATTLPRLQSQMLRV